MDYIIKDIIKRNLVDKWGDWGSDKTIHYDIDKTYEDFDDWYNDASINFIDWYVVRKFFDDICREEDYTLSASDVYYAMKYEKQEYGESYLFDKISDDEDNTKFNECVLYLMMLEYFNNYSDRHAEKFKKQMKKWYEEKVEEEKK